MSNALTVSSIYHSSVGSISISMMYGRMNVSIYVCICVFTYKCSCMIYSEPILTFLTRNIQIVLLPWLIPQAQLWIRWNMCGDGRLDCITHPDEFKLIKNERSKRSRVQQQFMMIKHDRRHRAQEVVGYKRNNKSWNVWQAYEKKLPDLKTVSIQVVNTSLT
jgi:hypothetical protein